MSVARTVLKNVASSWVGLGSQLIVTFLLTPFVIQELGVEAYGVWLLLQGMVGYYGLIDMGLRAGLTQSITRRIAADDVEGVRRHISAAIPLLVGLAAVIMTIAVIVSLVLPRVVEMSSETASIVWLVVIIQAAGAALQMPIAPYGAVLVGLQRYDIANGISIVTRILFAVFTWGALAFGGGLVGLSMVLMATNCFDSFVRVVVAKRMLPGIRNAGYSFDRGELSEIANVGVWNFLIGISKQFIYFSDALVVGILFSASAVAPYGIAASIVDYGMRLVTSATKVLFPTMAHLCKNGDLSAQRELYITATRITLGVSLTILIVGTAWIGPFLRLWLGESPEKQIIHDQAPMLFAILGLAFTFVGFQRAGVQLLLATNRLKLVAQLIAAEAFINLVLSLALGWHLGPVGVAIGTLIPAALLSVLVHVSVHAKTLGYSYSALLARVVVRPLLFSMLLATLMAAVSTSFPPALTWPSLLLVAGASSFVSIACLSPILLSSKQFSKLRSQARIGARLRSRLPLVR